MTECHGRNKEDYRTSFESGIPSLLLKHFGRFRLFIKGVIIFKETHCHVF